MKRFLIPVFIFTAILAIYNCKKLPAPYLQTTSTPNISATAQAIATQTAVYLLTAGPSAQATATAQAQAQETANTQATETAQALLTATPTATTCNVEEIIVNDTCSLNACSPVSVDLLTTYGTSLTSTAISNGENVSFTLSSTGSYVLRFDMGTTSSYGSGTCTAQCCLANLYGNTLTYIEYQLTLTQCDIQTFIIKDESVCIDGTTTYYLPDITGPF